MPFPKRLVEPQLLCRQRPADPDAPPAEDLVSVSNAALARVLRQLSDLARHACSVFQELEDELVAIGLRVRGLQGRIPGVQQGCADLDPKQEAVPVSDLDVESKLTEHFRAPWPLQRSLLGASSRPPCLAELHQQAGLSLWTPHRDPQRRRPGSAERRVTISTPPVSSCPPSPSGQRPETPDPTPFDSIRSSSPTECCRFSPWSRKAVTSDPDADPASLGQRHRFPVPNPPTTLDKQTNWAGVLPLPTPEDRMKTSSLGVSSSVIPINVTGVGFDRDASVRCSLVHSQSVLQRRRKLRRRRTVAGVPRQVQRDLDSDDSPGSRQRAAGARLAASTEDLHRHLGTRDSGCQTEDPAAPGPASRRRLRSQRGPAVSLSAGNILFLSDAADAMFTASVGARLRSRSLPRDGGRATDDGRSDEDDDEEEEEEDLSPFDAEDFPPGPGDRILKDGEASAGERAACDRHLKYTPLPESPERGWTARTGSRRPRNADMGSREISSSSDTFGSPVHSVSAAGVRTEHKEEHQSSSGNWSGSSSTCPSQTSETVPPPPPGSSHCDSELSLNAAAHHQDDHAGFLLDHYQGLRTHRAGSFSSAAMDILEEAGVGAPAEEGWSYPDAAPLRPPRDFSPEPSREVESSLGCPSFTSMATCESSFSDKPPSEKADAVSHYSVDTEGYYTSMHFDCGIQGSRSFSYGGSESDVTLGRRCLSLRKPKAKPSPPKRSSSLRKICGEGHAPDDREPKTSSKERKLQLVLSNPAVGEPLAVWGAGGFGNLPDLGAFGATDACSFKDEGAVQADYADLWLPNDLKSSDPYRSLSNSSTATGTTVVDCIKSQESSGSQSSRSGSGATTPSLPSAEGDFLPTSPEKPTGLTSPSSGYSSQSETPTSSLPAAFFPGPLSPPGGKRKPRVPERKSSLVSASLPPPPPSLPVAPSLPPSLPVAPLAARRPPLPAPRCPPPLAARPPRCRRLPAPRCPPPPSLPVAPPRCPLPPLAAPLPVAPPSLPVAPPSHLDLSSLSAAPGSQIQTLHQNPPRPAHPTLVTPSALHAVRLRPVATEPEGRRRDGTPPALVDNVPGTPVLCGASAVPLRRPPSDGSCESLFTSDEELADEESRSETGEASADRYEGETAGTPERSDEEAEEEEVAALSMQHSSPGGPDEAPSVAGQSEASDGSPIGDGGSRGEEPEAPGASAQRASEGGGEESADSSGAGDPAAPPLVDDLVFLTPAKARTTEDLFAMIHRSKRKLLGRKDSTEPSARNRLGAASGGTPPGSPAGSPVSPVSPPGSSPVGTPPGLHRVSGSIFRSAKKSSTSNEEFKLLLLRKGSRSEAGYRMSATEILKSPGAPKSFPADFPMDSPGRPEEPASPLRSGPDRLSGHDPRADAEGFSPKPLLSPAASRQGRPRIPPPANSSRYGARGRLYPAPMQAISEGEAENSDGSPPDERSPPGSTEA
ncbi:actin remodeling regulator NHS [Pseudoliparis swirei]|uniref:actin remodeling regulator NHS n=1 Tax=Pseudoliparis swirei TaxID=2059687 RepID=UPI0024BE86B8|nr:actin remodeling regulator NHS [Pseudoliparis swirei]